MTESRRDVSSRNKNIFHKLSRGLIKIGLRPNHISILSVVFAVIGAYGFFIINNNFWLGVILALLGIQLRLVCNLIDGLMAVEGKLSSPQGELYNDVPDRFSDWFLIISVGFVISIYPYSWEFCWLAVVLAILTAYVRVLGASQKVGHFFVGPMAKQHRMALLNLGLIGLIFEKYIGGSSYSLYYTVIIIAFGSFITVVRRLYLISKKLGETS